MDGDAKRRLLIRFLLMEWMPWIKFSIIVNGLSNNHVAIMSKQYLYNSGLENRDLARHCISMF